MRLKRDTIKNAELLADETNSVIIGKKIVSGKLGQMSPHEIVSDGYTKRLRKRK